jgi:transposase
MYRQEKWRETLSRELSESEDPMRPLAWHPPVEPSSLEQIIITRIKRAELFVFLRHHRHELFDDAFQEELATLYALSLRGHPPIPPAQLALATIVQAYTGVSDDEVIEATLMDRRWQLVLDCLDSDQAPFSKGTLVAFRKLLIEAQMDRRLIERTIEVASQSQAFGPRSVRAALDSSPLWGAGRLEDTYNLLGHALKKVLRVVAEEQGRKLSEVAQEAGAEMVSATSLKAALDRDWDQVSQREEALALVLNVLHTVENWVQTLQQEEKTWFSPRFRLPSRSKSKMWKRTSRAKLT